MMHSAPSEDEPPLPTPDKGKKKEVGPASAFSSGIHEPQRFSGLKDKIIGSLHNVFSEGDGQDQEDEDSLFQGENNLVGSLFTFTIVSLD